MPDQLVAVFVPAEVHHHPHACIDRELAIAEHERNRHRLDQTPRHGLGLRLCCAVEQQRELVAAQPRQRVRGAHHLVEAARDSAQQLVSHVVAERVVHLLEAVEVHEQHGQHLLRAHRAREGLVKAVAEQRPVGEPGEAVVEGLARELLLEPHALTHVARVDHHAAHVAVAAEIGHVGVEMAPLVELVQHPKNGLRRLAGVLHRGGEREVVRVQQILEAVLEQLALRPPEHSQHRLADVAAAAVAEHHHEVRGRRDEAAEVRGLAARGGDQGPGQQQRDEQAERPERHLERDQPVDVVVGGGRDRARGVEGDAGGKCRENT